MRTRSRIKLGIASAATAAIVLSVWLLTAKVPHTSRPEGKPAISVPSPRLQAAVMRTGGGTSKGNALEVSGRTYKEALKDSRDYWEYASRVLPAARAGDRDAQFYLSRALDRCQSDLRMYLQQGSRPLTQEESLQWAAKRNLPLDLAQQAYERCHKFQERGPGEFGDSADWLGKATLAGQPLAQATTAARILLQQKTETFAKAGGVPVTVFTIAPDTAHLDPRRLFREAVESGDPEALFAIGEADALLHPSTGNNGPTEQYAWWLVACEEGFDCSPNAEWVKRGCYLDPQCASAVSPSDVVEHLAGNDWPQVQQRAQELKIKLDAHEWDDLGLGGKD